MLSLLIQSLSLKYIGLLLRVKLMIKVNKAPRIKGEAKAIPTPLEFDIMITTIPVKISRAYLILLWILSAISRNLGLNNKIWLRKSFTNSRLRNLK